VLHKALGQAVKLGLLARSPCEFVEPPRIRRPEMQVLDEEQVRIFLGEAKRSSRYYSLYLMAVLTGMREGELLGLRWKDVDLTLGVASIQQTFYRLGRQRLLKQPKSEKGRRRVALPPVLVEELGRLKAKAEEKCRTRGRCPSSGCQDRNCVHWHDHGLVFCQPTVVSKSLCMRGNLLDPACSGPRRSGPAEFAKELRHPSQVVVVVLGDEEGVVDQVHRHAQARMEGRVRQRAVIHRLQPADERRPGLTEAGQQRGQGLAIVVGLMGPAVGEVSRGHLRLTGQEVLHPLPPQRLKVQQVPGVFLDGPGAAGAACERRGGQGLESLFQTGRRAAEALDDDREQLGRQACRKLPLEPRLFSHRLR